LWFVTSRSFKDYQGSPQGGGIFDGEFDFSNASRSLLRRF